MTIEIRRRITGEVVYTWPGDTLHGAHLSRADLSGANLSRADLSRADLSGANLRGANLRWASLREADLRCSGNMRQLRTMQIDTWQIGYTPDTLQIGCQRHAIGKWARWSTEAGRAWIAKMDPCALAWAERNLDLVLAIIAANPAEK